MATDPVLLKNFSCFQDLSEEQLNAIANITDAVCYPPNHTIFEEGVMGKSLYFLLKGDVEILFNTGKPSLMRIDVKTGLTVMGCSVLMEPYMYAATNRSLTKAELLEVKVPELMELIKKDCQLGMAIQRLLINFMREYILRLRNLLGGRI